MILLDSTVSGEHIVIFFSFQPLNVPISVTQRCFLLSKYVDIESQKHLGWKRPLDHRVQP